MADMRDGSQAQPSDGDGASRTAVREQPMRIQESIGVNPPPAPEPPSVDFDALTTVQATAGTTSVTVTGSTSPGTRTLMRTVTGVTIGSSSGESWDAQKVGATWAQWTCTFTPMRPGTFRLTPSASLQGRAGLTDSVDGEPRPITVKDPGVSVSLKSPAQAGSLSYHAQVDAQSPIGVVGVRCSGDGGATFVDLRLTNALWVGDVPLAVTNPVSPSGQQVTLRIQSYDVPAPANSQLSQLDVPLTAKDVTPPAVTWLAPADDGFVVEVLPADQAGATVPVRVHVDDTANGVVSAGFAAYTSDVTKNPLVCDNGSGTTVALAQVPNEDGVWQAVVPVPGIGTHTLALTCRDQAGLSTVVTRTVVVRGSDVGGTTERDYLADLIDFIGRRLVTGAGGQPVGPRDLAGALHQPFAEVAHTATRLPETAISAARGAVQVLRDYLSPQPPPPAARWALDEGAGSVVHDSAGDADGTGTALTWGPGPTTGSVAAVFDGSSSYVSIGAAPDLTVTEALTLAAWVKPAAPGPGGASGGVIVGREGAFLLARFPDGTLQWALATATPGWRWVPTGATVPASVWSHVAVSYDGANVRTFVNGTAVPRIAATGPITPTGAQHDVRIGCRQAPAAGSFFAGAIADVRVYDRALYEYDVKALVGRVPEADQVWLDDDLPPGTQPDPAGNEPWSWTSANPAPFSGSRCHASPLHAGMHQHYFTPQTDGWQVSPGDVIYTYVYLDPANKPAEIMLQFDEYYVTGWDHRAFWSDDPTGAALAWGTPGTASRRYMGPLPPAGRWVRLEVPAAAVGLERKAVARMAFTAVGGQLWWDRTGVVSGRHAVQTCGYPEAAYRAVLTALGTSLEELRAARGADTDTRTRLAARLGILLRKARPDELDDLLLPAAQVGEADLLRLFGLRPTDGDPLAALPGTPQLTAWRTATVRAGWAVQDWSAGPDAPPVVDPDLVGYLDLVTPLSGPAERLLADRIGWVTAAASRLQGLVQTGATDAANLAAVIAAVFPRFAWDQVAAERADGADVSAALATVGLDGAGFDRLVMLKALAAAGSLLPDEWADAMAICVQTLKVRQFPQWRLDEQAVGVLLDPALFRPDGTGPAGVSPWRAPAQARVGWQQRLLARTEQLAGLDASLADALAAAERAALPLLRDAALAVAAGGDPDGLSARLGVDLQAGALLTTTQLDQAVEALQGLLAAVDAGGGLGALGLPWQLKAAVSRDAFAGERAWMATYAAWSSAMNLYFYPESHLLPAARPRQGTSGQEMSTAFGDLLDGLADPLPDSAPVPAQPPPGYGSARLALASYVAEVQGQAGSLLAALAPAHYPPPLVPTGSWPTAADLLTGSQLEAYRVAQAGWFSPAGQPRYASFAAVPSWARELLFEVPVALALQLAKGHQWEAALNWLRLVYDRARPAGSRQIFAGFALDATAGSPSRGDDWLGAGLPDAHQLAASRGGSYLRYTVLTVATMLCDWADDEFARDTAESRARARALYGEAADVLADPVFAHGVPATNPEFAVLSSRATNGLAKLRAGLNIAGMVRPLSTIDGGGAAAAVPPATTYRYSTLVSRAQQLLAAATQVEDRYLASLEKKDAESYNLLLAGQDLAVAATRVTIAQEQAAIATKEVGLAQQQVARAALQSSTYQQWIAAGPNQFERDMLSDYQSAQNYREWAAHCQAAGGILSGIGGLLGGIATGGPLGIISGVSSLLGGAANAGAAELSASAENAMTDAQVAGTQASWERRQEEWALQKSLADVDLATGKQQVDIATDRAAVAADEAAAAAQSQANAQAKLDFLSSKFTNAQLYAWMSGVLGGVYRQLLQQATAVARLAEQQLAFERQSVPTGYVKADYWSPTTATAAAGSTGLTGSSRLLADLSQLDEYAFETNRRKLQLTQTFSLAAICPVDLERFRQTGVLPFAVPLDRWGSPGTYLGTIRRVRLSIGALVPPDVGVRGTLTGGGTSHLVVADGAGFRAETLTRAPEAVVVTTPAGASGVFEVDLTPELLLPWEGCGLDLNFELRLPKALNAFDYRTIADVQLTVDFTAFYSADYAASVTRAQPSTRTQTVVLRLRDDVDAWYALVTAAEQARAGGGAGPAPLLATWQLTDRDVAANAEPPLGVESVTVMVVRGGSSPTGFAFDHLTVNGQPAPAVTSTAASTVGDIVSTRSGAGAGWVALRGLSPVGAWELGITGDGPTVGAFADGDVDDLVLIVDYRAGVPG